MSIEGLQIDMNRNNCCEKCGKIHWEKKGFFHGNYIRFIPIDCEFAQLPDEVTPKQLQEDI